jgi:hypothetical protein
MFLFIIHYFDALPLQKVVLVTMVTMVINHVAGVYLIPLIKKMVSVHIYLDVNLEDNLDRCRSVVEILKQCLICFSYRTK